MLRCCAQCCKFWTDVEIVARNLPGEESDSSLTFFPILRPFMYQLYFIDGAVLAARGGSVERLFILCMFFFFNFSDKRRKSEL